MQNGLNQSIRMDGPLGKCGLNQWKWERMAIEIFSWLISRESIVAKLGFELATPEYDHYMSLVTRKPAFGVATS